MYKIVVCGCGAMSAVWIDIVRKRGDCEIVGLADIRVEAAEEKKEKFQLDANVYPSIYAALEKEAPDIVLDITTPEAHFEIVTAALEAGCDVFGEKPMSDSLENAEKMVACAEKTGKEYFVMQNRRYVPGVWALRDLVQSRKLGGLGQVSVNYQMAPRFGGFRDEMDSPLIADMAIHTFDAARFITGKNAVSVYCHEFNPSWSWYRGDSSAVCIFEMEDGSVFDYRGSWCANGLSTSWESEWRLTCADGSAFWDGADKLFCETSSVSDLPLVPLQLLGHEACINEMFDALGRGTRPQTDCRDNINSIRMVQKAIESAKQKQLIIL